MKNKSILYRFGLVVLVVLLLVLILPSSKIDLASKTSAPAHRPVSGPRAPAEFCQLQRNGVRGVIPCSDDDLSEHFAKCFRGVRLCQTKLSQNYSSYSHEFPVDSITVSYYDDAEQHQLLLTVYSDGVCILNNAFVSVKYPGGGAAELYQALAEIVE